MDELIIADQKYISSKRASEVTGYAKDYIGQLCREGRVEARLVGRSWYVREAAIKDHRFGAENEEGGQASPKLDDTTVAPKEKFDALRYKIEPLEPIRAPQVEVAPEEPISTEGEILYTSRIDEVPDLASKMQEAWQSWFNKNEETVVPINREKPQESEQDTEHNEILVPENTEPVATAHYEESAETLEASEEGVEVKVNRVQYKGADDLDTIPVRHYQESVQEEKRESSVRQKRPNASVRSYFALRTTLVLVAIVAFSIAGIGTGIINLPQSIGGVAASMLSGTKIINK